MSRFFVHRVRAAAMVAAAVLLGATLALSPRPACAAEPDALSFVPKGTAVVITIRPAALLSDDTLGPVLNGLLASVPMEKEVGITPQQISRATVAFKVMEPEPVGLGVVETTEDVDWSAVLKRIAPTAEATKFGDYTGAADEQRKFYAAVIGPRMAIVGNSDVLLEDAIERSQAPGKSQEWLKPLLGNDADVLIAAGFDHAPIAPLVENALRTKGSPENVIAAAMFEPLWKDVKSTTAKFKFKPKLQLEIVATCSSPEAAPEVKKTLDAVTVLSTNMARGYLDLAPRGRTPEEKLQRTAVK
ncbi:MAG TPA: hypothetical protein VGE52_14860, partial [Pirellulales bacterium]